MKALFVSFFFTLLAFGALTLEKTYYFTHSTILSRDLFPELEINFELFSIPEHLIHINIAQQRLFELFAKQGIQLSGEPHGLVHFKRKSMVDLSAIETEIATYYLKHLPFLTVGSVFVEPKSYLTTLPQKYELVFKRQAYKNNQGTVKLQSGSERLFFDYTVHATYSHFQAATDLKKGETISTLNTELSVVAFDALHADLIGYEMLDLVETKRPVRKGTPLTKRDIAPKTLVKRGSIVNVKLREDNILINFTATALSNGRLGDTIFIERSDASKLKAEVIGENKVQLK